MALAAALFAAGSPARAGELGAAGYQLIAELVSGSAPTRSSAAESLIQAGDRSLVPGLVDAVFFTDRDARSPLYRVLEALTGESFRGYYDWVAYVGSQVELRPAPGYLQWKSQLLSRIDRAYEGVLYDGAPARIRLEEIVWGGVPLAGIPALDDPPTIAGRRARYLRPDEQVFGLTLGGESRAYPLRILSWHELVNDRLGGQPIVLSFCTLCGSGIFYRALATDGEALRFDTSGLLYRSNKLMVDRSSRTLWSNLTGEAVLGRRAGGPERLDMLPGTLSRWRAWLEAHPDTTVLDLEGVERTMAGRVRYDYRPGAADRARRGVSFPVWQRSEALEPDREVFTLRLGAAAKAYPLDRVLAAAVVNDTVGGVPVVIVGDAESGAVRAFRRGDRRFAAAGRGRLLDASGRPWSVTEAALRPEAGDAEDAAQPRLAGHVARWFGWFAFYPHTEIWSG